MTSAVGAMAGDLVDRLRLGAHAQEITSVWNLTVVRCSLLIEAADEIERLRADVEDWRWACNDANEIIERLRDTDDDTRRRNRRYQDEIKQLRAENERLQTEVWSLRNGTA